MKKFLFTGLALVVGVTLILSAFGLSDTQSLSQDETAIAASDAPAAHMTPSTSTLKGKVTMINNAKRKAANGKIVNMDSIIVSLPDDTAAIVVLGPADFVSDKIHSLQIDDEVTVEGFQPKMAKNGKIWIAKNLSWGDKVVQLRNDSMQPLWKNSQEANQ
jgi:hypothetical protein